MGLCNNLHTFRHLNYSLHLLSASGYNHMVIQVFFNFCKRLFRFDFNFHFQLRYIMSAFNYV